MENNNFEYHNEEEDFGFFIGLFNGIALSIPLWLMIIAIIRFVIKTF